MDEVHASIGDQGKPLAEQLNDEFTKAVIPVTVFVGLEVVLGFFGNLLVIYAFLFHYHVCNFRYFVLCLAFNDITCTLTTMPGEMVTHLYWYIYPVPEICKVKSFFNMFTMCSEAFCLLTIAVDRYRKVCKPFGWQIKPSVAILVCLIIYIVAAILASPVPFLWGISYNNEVYNGVNVTTTICEKDGKYKDTGQPIKYSITIGTILLITVIAMFVLYVLVARTLLKKKRENRISGKCNNTQTSSTTVTGGSSSNAIDLNAESGLSENSSNFYEKKGKKEIQLDERTTKGIQSKQSDISKTSKKSSINIWQIVLPAVYTGSDVPTGKSKGPISDDDDRHARCKTTNNSAQPRSMTSRKSKVRTRVRRKTRIMFVLTLIFMITTVLYLTMLTFIASSDDVLASMNHAWRALYFLLFRLYFINHVINPVVYGLLDPHFRMVLQKMKSK